MSDPIKIEGLREFRASLKRFDSDLPKSLRKGLNVAMALVVDKARPDIPRRTGRAVKSLRAASTQTTARARGGSRKAPYYPWLDFGGKAGPNKSIKRPFVKEGRYLYHAYYGLRDSGAIQRALTDALIGVAVQAGLEVTRDE